MKIQKDEGQFMSVECPESGMNGLPGKIGGVLYKIAIIVIKVMGISIFLYLLLYNVRYTGYMPNGGPEIMFKRPDSIIQNGFVLFACLLISFGLYSLEKKLTEVVKKRICLICLISAMVWIGIYSIWWLGSIDRPPVADSSIIYALTSSIIEGGMNLFTESSYIDVYPHQLNFVFILEVLFRMVGASNYQAYQLLCVFLSPLIVLAGYKVAQGIRDSFLVKVMYCILISACMPIVFYTTWVYGEIPSIFFTFLGVWMLFKYRKTKQIRYLVCMAVSMMFGIIMRNHTLIFLIAMLLMILIDGIIKRDYKLLMGGLILVLLPWFATMGIRKSYEIRQHETLDQGLPYSAWIAMGLQEGFLGYGWYNIYTLQIHEESGYKKSETHLVAMNEIKSRMEYFYENIRYAGIFFHEKILSQWNDPLYQSMYFSITFNEETPGNETFLYRFYYKELYDRIFDFCNRIQFIIYTGTLLYFLLVVKRGNNLLNHSLAVAIIGGFLFSIIWEAKARYIFPYYVSMFPLACAGYYQLVATLEEIYFITIKKGLKYIKKSN